MSLKECKGCGQPGATFCSQKDEIDSPVGDWYHPFCFATAKEPPEYEYLKPAGGHRGRTLPARAEVPLRLLRNRQGQVGQSVLPALRWLQAKARRLSGSKKGNQCL